MFLTTKNPTQLETYITSMFSRYKDVLLAIHKGQWNDEDIRGYSSQQYVAQQYQMAITLAVLVRLEVDRLQGQGYEWSYFVAKFKLDEMKERLSCINVSLDVLNDPNFQSVSLDNILTDAGLPTVESSFPVAGQDGIETMGIGISFEIEPPAVVDPPDDVIGVVVPETYTYTELLADGLKGCQELTCSV